LSSVGKMWYGMHVIVVCLEGMNTIGVMVWTTRNQPSYQHRGTSSFSWIGSSHRSITRRCFQCKLVCFFTTSAQ